MKSNGERSLKSLNMKWLVLLAVADVLAVLFFVAPEFVKGASLTQIGIGRVLTTTVMPVFVFQCLVTAFSARWNGIRFVCNVLAIHSARKITAQKASAAKQPAT